MFMTMLSLTSIPKSVTGKSMIVEMIGKMVDFDKGFSADEEDAVDRLLQCYHAAADFFSVRDNYFSRSVNNFKHFKTIKELEHARGSFYCRTK